MRRRPHALALAVLAASVALVAVPGGAAQARAARPLPLDPGRPTSGARTPGRAAGLPDHRRNPGLRAVLAEKDADRGVESPALSALCQNGIGVPNPYRRPAPNVDAIVGDTIVTAGSQTGCSAAQNETSIAVNPENPRNLVAGANDYRVFNAREGRNDGSGWAYTSLDGGRTWADVQLPGLTLQSGGTGAFEQFDSAGDPAISFGPDDTVYYANIVFSRFAPTRAGTEPANGISLSVSHDGGLHWDQPLLIRADGVEPDGTLTPTHIFNDKVWVAGDPGSSRVYVTWTRFKDNPDGSYLESPIVVAASQDRGRTFGQVRRVDTTLGAFRPGGLTPYSQGSNPKVGRDGTLYVAYEGEVCATLACDNFGVTDRDVTVVATSRDHGQTFTRAVVGTNDDFPFFEPLGTATLTGENFRVNSFPQLDLDRSSGLMAVSWNDDRNGRYDPATGESLRSNGDNIVSLSLDGRRWTSPASVGTAQDEVYGAVAVHGTTVVVTSYTRHWDPAGVNLDYAYWTSTDLWRADARARLPLPVHRLSTQSSDPRIQFVSTDDEGNEVQGVFIGDYTASVVGSDGRLHACWTDFRGRPGTTAPNQDVYVQSVQVVPHGA